MSDKILLVIVSVISAALVTIMYCCVISSKRADEHVKRKENEKNKDKIL